MPDDDMLSETEVQSIDARLRAAFANDPLPVPPRVRARLDKLLESNPPLTLVQTGDNKLVRPIRVNSARKSWLWPLLATAACLALLVAGIGYWVRRPSLATPAGLYPQGLTATTQPFLNWDVKPGTAVNLWILPAEGSIDAEPLFKAENVTVTPPVRFAQLKAVTGSSLELEPGKSYRFLACTVGGGRLAGTPVLFTVAADATPQLPLAHSPADAVAHARKLEADGRLGDALMFLDQLSADWKSQREIAGLRSVLLSRLLPTK